MVPDLDFHLRPGRSQKTTPAPKADILTQRSPSVAPSTVSAQRTGRNRGAGVLIGTTLKEPLNRSRSPSTPLSTVGDGVTASARRPTARRGFRGPPGAGRPSGGPKGRLRCCGSLHRACHTQGGATRPGAKWARNSHTYLRDITLGSYGLPGLVHRHLSAMCALANCRTGQSQQYPVSYGCWR